MSIVDALNRAKQMQKSRAESGVRLPESSIDVAHRPVEQPLEEIVPIAFTTVDVDLDSCKKNRVLFPGSVESHNRAVDSAYRMLRTRVLHRARANGWTTIGVTSACPNDGKTLTAVNLALCLAREKNSNTILIDLDMRNPSICKILAVMPPGQITEYFDGATSMDKLFFSVNGADGLLIAGGTRSSERSSELLSKPKFDELIASIRRSTIKPLVIIDLPPVLATDDALMLAPRLDALLVVASEGQTDRGELDRALGLLAEFHIAGIVLNRSRHAAHGYQEYY